MNISSYCSQSVLLSYCKKTERHKQVNRLKINIGENMMGSDLEKEREREGECMWENECENDVQWNHRKISKKRCELMPIVSIFHIDSYYW